MANLYFYHDPMCSWCWGYRPVSDQIFSNLPESVQLVKVLGGLAADSDQPMPENLREGIPKAWLKIRDLLGTEFNFEFWTKCKPRRSTYPACRAVIAAGIQDQYDEMVDAIQRAYYLRAMNPSDVDTLELLADEIGLDTERFATDIRSPDVNVTLRGQIDFARESPIDGFPSLVIDIDDRMIPVTRDYRSANASLEHIGRLLCENQEPRR
ncbi:MAG: DsbA family protein [Proteobacteria bacterium]|nr:DsbA family protein [Pseudomonadota bacterium]MDA0993715.1 DsbA family protein [Pseudomonadota bacterium]